MKKLAIVAGGTGGHIYPGIALAQALPPGVEVFFIGSFEGLERTLVPLSGQKIKLIHARPLIRKICFRSLTAPVVSLWGFFEAFFLLKKYQPDAVFSTGGYVSWPVALAARANNLPVYLHEQNVLPGITNRLLRFIAKRLFLSFDQSLKYCPGQVTGNPVRQEIIKQNRFQARQGLGYQPTDKVILIVGGSQGARTINQAVLAALPRLKDCGVKLIHIIGSRDYSVVVDKLKETNYGFYRPQEYLYNMSEVLAAADLVVSRAGATAIAEYLIRNLPMVLVPFPYAAENHQWLNAKIVAEAGAARVVKNEDLTADKLISIAGEIDNLLLMKENCSKLARPKATEEIIRALA